MKTIFMSLVFALTLGACSHGHHHDHAKGCCSGGECKMEKKDSCCKDGECKMDSKKAAEEKKPEDTSK